MPLARYGVLAGRVVDRKAEGGTDTPHYQVQVAAGGEQFRVAVNELSKEHPSELLYLADEAFHHPIVQDLLALPEGVQLPPEHARWAGAGLHPGQPVRPDAAARRTGNRARADNDLGDKLDHFVERAEADPAARLYAFGQRWGPEPGIPDKVFGFLPGNGVHDIHMNQGNSQQFRSDDGVWQDGGLLLHYPAQDQWVAIFLAFQSQAWHTDDQTGHAITGPGPGGPEAPDHTVRIVAALVNPIGPAPEAETVTLVNASTQDLDLAGWSILDQEKRQLVLEGGLLASGDAVRIHLGPPVALGNRGGLITLLNPDGLKVDGVAYTKSQADTEGWTLVF
jgi:uncharacterized protein YukJ